MAVENVKMEFTNDFQGFMETENGKVMIGRDMGEMKPYNLLFGALGSCFYATFLGIVEKKKLTFDGATLEISGVKRTEIPNTLESVLMKLVIKNASNEKQFLRSVELGAKYCSIHETISQVAKIDIEVEFE